MNIRFGAARVIIGNMTNPDTNTSDIKTNTIEQGLYQSMKSTLSQVLLDNMEDGVVVCFTREKEDEKDTLKMRMVNPGRRTCSTVGTNITIDKMHCVEDVVETVQESLMYDLFMFVNKKYLNQPLPVVPLEKNMELKNVDRFINTLEKEYNQWS